MVSNLARWGGAVVILVAAIALGSFAQDAQDPVPEAEASQTRFLRKMYATDRTSYGDAARLVHSLVKGEHSTDGFDQIDGDLKRRGVADPSWSLGENDKLTRGVLAYMLVKALDIKGGATMRIFGVSERYALRETNYRKLLTGKFRGEFVSGRELIDVIQRASIWKEEGSIDSLLK